MMIFANSLLLFIFQIWVLVVLQMQAQVVSAAPLVPISYGQLLNAGIASKLSFAGLRSLRDKLVQVTTPETKRTEISLGLSELLLTDDARIFLETHNNVRADHGAVPLTWSFELQAAAEKWANGCKLEHSGGTLGPFGENLGAGTGDFSIETLVGLWAEDVSDYDPANPQPSRFTQVVWKETTEIGCAKASCDNIFDPSFGTATYYVCEYSSSGNVIGEFPQNVQV